MFAYCENNPVNKADPTGHEPFFATFVAANLWNVLGWAVAATIVVVVVVALVVKASKSVDETGALARSQAESEKRTETYKNQSIYTLTNSNGQVRYVGRTNDPKRREYQHKHNPLHPERQSYNMNVIMTDLNPIQAKLAEQILISAYTVEHLDNARREIAVGKLGKYLEHVQSVVELFAGLAEDELMNLMER